MTVTPRPAGADGLPGGFDVDVRRRPRRGPCRSGRPAPFTVDGTEVALHRTNRFDNPFGTTEAGASVVEIAEAGAALRVDTATGERHASLRRGRH